MSRIFISHAGIEADKINPVATRLTALGHRVLGREVPGQDQLFVGSALQQLEAADVTVVLVASLTGREDFVREDIMHAIRKDKGVLALQLDAGADTPSALHEAGAEVLNWSDPEDLDYLPRAIAHAERSARVLAAAVKRGAGSGAPCARPQR
jgi:hypothetical protein